MSLSSENSSVSPSFSRAEQRYNQALELEKQLRGVVQAKGPFDSHARALRNNIRECYEAVVLEDHEFAEVHEVEQAIWRLHYKQIDEFRAKIKKNSAIAAAGPAVPIPGGKSASKQELMHKILAAFKSFLGEATGFYHNLILKLRAKHDLPQDYLAFEVTSDDDEKRAAEVKRCENSCHRCLIFLGDLARYKEVHGDGQDWSVSAGYYLQASALWPSSGNPHNQVCGFLFSWISYMGLPIFWAAY
jgi:protein SMG7